MTDDPRIPELVEEALSSGRSPEEVCAEDPHLLPAVRERWLQCRSVEAQIDQVFPPSSRRPGPRGSPAARPASPPSKRLPQIPGYEVQSILGRGGMGIVYRARDQRLNRAVALKMLLAGDLAAPQELARFAREAEAVAGLQHEHIVQVHEVGDLDGRPYFTMELVEGGSLAQKLQGRPLDPRDVADLLGKIARAVQVAHDSGIVHRDLKPANILLTADGIPKISDFGLARRLTPGDSALTVSGDRIGTPSYMAPEQAIGKAGAAGPLVDVYALGAILYEMLTGRSPFGGGTPAETERRLLSEEPVPPSRLSAAVPRDLERISLKCLSRDPQCRYRTPSELADDLDRFLRGEPVAARPVGLPERASKWARRRPSEAALLVGSAMVLFAILGGGLWFRFERASATRAVADDLREVARHQDAAAWSDARAILARAEARLGNGGPEHLRSQLRQAKVDLDLVSRLEVVLLDRAAVVHGSFNIESNKARADQQYEAAYRDAGYGDVRGEPQAMADRIAESQVRDALVAALDAWAACAPDEARRERVMAVARLADRPPRDLRNRLRDAAAWNDRTALTGLTDFAMRSGASVQLLVALGDRLDGAGGDAVPFLTWVQQEHPGDFWANFALGEALRKRGSLDAVRYFQAAAAVEPRAAVAHNNLGITLRAHGRFAEAADHFRLALRMDGAYAPAHNNLGIALAAEGRLDEAIGHYLKALRREPDDGDTHNNLGLALAEKGRTAEAIQHYRRAVQLDPGDGPAHNNLGIALARAGRPQEAIAHYAEALRASPNDPAVRNNIGIVLRDLGRTDEAIAHLEHALRIKPGYSDAHANIGIAYRTKGQADEAIGHFEKALEANDNDGGNHNNLGMALAAKGRMAEAIEHYRRATKINPNDGPAHNNLGLALRATGQLDHAIDHFREALRANPIDAAARDNLAMAMAEKGQPRQ